MNSWGYEILIAFLTNKWSYEMSGICRKLVLHTVMHKKKLKFSSSTIPSVSFLLSSPPSIYFISAYVSSSEVLLTWGEKNKYFKYWMNWGNSCAKKIVGKAKMHVLDHFPTTCMVGRNHNKEHRDLERLKFWFGCLYIK